MRIAYISLHWARTFSSGVGKKIHRQMETWESLGHETCLFMHSEATRDPNLLPGEKFFYPTQTGFIQRELGRVRAAKEMLHVIQSYAPDIIFLRDGMYVFPIHRLANIAPIIGEINTNDIEQHKGLGLPYSLYNRLTRGILLRAVSGLNYVSAELAELPNYQKFHKKNFVSANGVDLQKYRLLKAPANETPNVIFIGSPGYVWHGVDKILTLAKNNSDIKIDVIGYDASAIQETPPENLLLHGYLPYQKYIKLFENADIAISSLAMHRVNLNEASPLKSREYLAYGLPTVLAYQDTDLDQLDVDYLLEIPNTEDNILTHGKLIRDFAYAMRGKRVNREEITPYIDSQIKEEKRLAFFQEIINQR